MKLPKVYNPSQYESDIYKLWEAAGAFEPKGKSGYTIIMPPPNANGNLHIGHALTVAVEDSLIRFHRMQGRAALYLPGADHAGFETQVVYEKQLEKEGKSRFDFSRDELYEQIMEFVLKNRGNMIDQTRALGASCDWSRMTFTLDEKVVETAYQTFKKLWDDGLVYRGERLVNYCTKHRTGFADIEVEYEEAKVPLYYMKYGPFKLATTRPETKFGDTAVAVHPEDDRYKDLIGTVVEVEGVNGKFELQVVADEYVDREFGTGVVKITPAHDFNDWEVAGRHHLPAVRVINHDGTMNHHAGRFEGLPVLEARKEVVKALKEKDLLIKIDNDYQTRIGKCYKCGTVIEPMLMKQWFIKVKPLAETAIEAIEQGRINFYPESKKAVTISYLENLKDWNISRQIAWGIPIPAFQNVEDEDDWIFDERVGDEIIDVEGKNYHRDPDVFDTWFSSGQWPFVTLNYPDGEDFKKFYPTSVMETGFDILYQWVSRMIMLGLYVTDEVPFKEVYLHGLVLDEQGQKMSKSKGNVINPMEILEKYGSDALRMGLLQGRSAGLNQAFAYDKIVGARNFANKLWNVARYIEGVLGDDYKHPKAPRPHSAADHWILSKLSRGAREVADLMNSYRLSEAYEVVYHLLWDDFADWYIETSKIELNKSVLAFGLETIIKITHPFAPFVTETIWETLAWEKDLIITSKWPKLSSGDSEKAEDFEVLKNVVSEIRYLRTELGLRESTLYHRGDKTIEANQEMIKSLAKLADIAVVESGYGLHLTWSDVDAWIDVEKNIIKQYYDKLYNRYEDAKQLHEAFAKKLGNKAYVKNAPKELVKETEQLKKDAEERALRIKRQMIAVETTLSEN
ncbi:MAG: valine--tRNA ligase [Candidatus Saccharimonadales bacterium]|nr:valine--tRNA ligase [Candidatus Saccharimonadales bacterium]